jgi:ABC-2 type transport system ATP-binding protein
MDDFIGFVQTIRKRLSTSLLAPLAKERGPECPDSAKDAAVETLGLVKRFGDEIAVNDLTFTVPRGCIFGFVGPSGCGKTTTIRLLTGFYRPTSGSAVVLGCSPQRFDSATRARIGYMPQSFVLYPNLTVWENLSFSASIYGVDLQRNDRFQQLLDFVQLTADKDKKAYELSGGMRRRLSLAATLTHDPELIFLDEPTAGIDPMLRQKLWSHFRELQEAGRTLFITTQYVGEAAYCDLVALLADGRLLALDTPVNLRRDALGGDAVDLEMPAPVDSSAVSMLEEFPFVSRVERTGDKSLRIIVDQAGTAVPILVQWHKDRGREVTSIQEYQPPFDEVFVQLVERDGR